MDVVESDAPIFVHVTEFALRGFGLSLQFLVFRNHIIEKHFEALNSFTISSTLSIFELRLLSSDLILLIISLSDSSSRSDGFLIVFDPILGNFKGTNAQD